MNKTRDFILILIWQIVSVAFFVHYSTDFVWSAFLFYGLPALYLSFKRPGLIRKTLLFSLAASIAMPFFFDYLAYLDSSWSIINSALRFFNNALTIEDTLWNLWWIYFSIIFWRYFISDDVLIQKFPKKFAILVTFLATLIISFFFIYFNNPSLLNIPYFYLKVGLLFLLIPFIAGLIYIKNKKGLLYFTCYTTFVSLIFDYSGMITRKWEFIGTHYIGTFNYFGSTMPYEEFLFWIILGAPGIIAWYKIFADSRK